MKEAREGSVFVQHYSVMLNVLCPLRSQIHRIERLCGSGPGEISSRSGGEEGTLYLQITSLGRHQVLEQFASKQFWETYIPLVPSRF